MKKLLLTTFLLIILIILAFIIFLILDNKENKEAISTNDNIEYREVIYTNLYKTNKIQIVRVNFDFNKFNLGREFIEDSIIPSLETNKNILKIYIEGHTDSKGKDWYNYRLGLQRAKTVSNIIFTNRNLQNIALKSFGYSNSIADNSTEEGRAINRRADIFIDLVEETFEIQTNLIKVDSKNLYNIKSLNIDWKILLLIFLLILLLLLAPKISGSLLLSKSKIAQFFGKLIIRFCKGFKYKLKGMNIQIPNTKKVKINYTKKPRDIHGIERKKFNNSIKPNFIKSLYKKYGDLGLKKIGFSDNDILKIKDGNNPNGFQVHHKFSLDDSGNNDFSNLVLIRNSPYHVTITNYQNSFMGKLNLNGGVLKNIDFPFVLGDILF